MSETQRPYFPFDQIEVPNIVFPNFVEENVCDWNLKIMPEGDCVDASVQPLTVFSQVKWLPVEYDKNIEIEEDGLGGKKNTLVRIDRIYSFEFTCDELNLWFIHEMIYKSEKIKYTTNGNIDIIGINSDIEYDVLTDGVYNVTIKFQGVDSYHSSFGITGCCKPLYAEAPYENECEDGGDINNYEPPCDTIVFNVTENSGTLTANLSGNTTTGTIKWYYRADQNSPWVTLITGATSISLGGYGYYRASATVAGCGTYIDQYAYLDPCLDYDVRIRRSTGNGLIAETVVGSTFVWEFNDGTGWITLSDTTAAIVASLSGDYRVTASYNDCEDSDVYYVTLAVAESCDYAVSIDQSGTVLTAVTDAANPVYSWVLETESGTSQIGTGNQVSTNETGIYWLYVTDGNCTKAAHKLYVKPENCISICNWDEMPLPQTTIINNIDACCDEENPCPSLTLSIVCINRVLTLSGQPATATITWTGPNGFTATGNNVSFPNTTPSGTFTATVVDENCTYTANYVYTKPNAGTAISDPINI